MQAATNSLVRWPSYMPQGGQRHAAFHGGSLLCKAVLQQQQQTQATGTGGGPGGPGADKALWITKQDYNEFGPHVVAQRCALR